MTHSEERATGASHPPADAGRPREERPARPTTLDAAEMRAWRAFLQAHALVSRDLEAEMLAKSDLPLAEYDVLVQLAMSEGRRLRMRDLADRVVLSRGGITRLVDRLVDDDLVQREKCGDDARGSWAVLTERGLGRLRDASPCHLAAVKRLFTDAFDSAELETLARMLENVPAVADRAGARAVAERGRG